MLPLQQVSNTAANVSTAASSNSTTWCHYKTFCSPVDPCGQREVTTAAWVGVGLFAFVVVGAIYRLIVASLGRSNKRTKVFYFLVVLCAACEIVSQVALGFCGAPTHYSFPFHLLSEQLLLVSFSIIVAMWSAIICTRRRTCVIWAFGVLNFIGVAFTIVVAVICFNSNMPRFRGDNCTNYTLGSFEDCAYNFQAVFLVNSQCLLTVAIVGSGFFYCRAKQYRKPALRSQHGNRQSCTSRCDEGRDGTAARLFLAIIICAVCFMLRVVMEALAYSHHRSNDAWINMVTWYVLAYWTPTAPPCVCMLFVMRLQKQYTRAAAQHLLEDPAQRGSSMSTGTDSDAGIVEYYNYRRGSDSLSSTGTNSSAGYH
eukprot:INCI12946.1.p1 GENE.INCI12946.1~~INCI12946.1.p1  ORF type:complete len:369 (-),score=31.66 INCI12946.1:373-1479(-)